MEAYCRVGRRFLSVISLYHSILLIVFNSQFVCDFLFFFFFQAEDGIRDLTVTGVQTCALPIWRELYVDAQDQAHHRGGPARADRGVRAVHVERPDVELLEGGARGIRPEILQEGLDL